MSRVVDAFESILVDSYLLRYVSEDCGLLRT